LRRQVAVGDGVVGMRAEAVVGDGDIDAAEELRLIVPADADAVVVDRAVARADAAVILVAGAGGERRPLAGR
jgi:hypothetical protein